MKKRILHCIYSKPECLHCKYSGECKEAFKGE